MPDSAKLRVFPKVDSGPEFYRSSPLRNNRLVLDVALSSLVVVMSIGVVVGFWGRMRFSTDIWFAAMIIWLIRAWTQVVRDYQRLHSLFREGVISDIPSGSPLEAAISVAANMTHSNLSAFSMILIFAMALFIAAMLGKA